MDLFILLTLSTMLFRLLHLRIDMGMLKAVGDVCDQKNGQGHTENISRFNGKFVIEPHIKRQKKTILQHAEHAEAKAGQQTDPPVQVKNTVTVIPPAHAEDQLQQDAANVFHHRTYRHGA